eukprot:gene35870-46562_t
MWPPNVLLLADALPASKPLISISGQSFHLPVFAPEVFELAALDFVQNFDWSEDILSRDRDLLRTLGSLDHVLEHFSAKHRGAGMNEKRVRQWLSAEPRLQLLLSMVNDGGEVDTDADFIPFRHSGPLRPLQQRLLPVYRFHAHKMWKAGKGLLFRLSDIPLDTLEHMHTGNSCHLVPKPDTPEGWDQAIQRYGAVQLPNIMGVLHRWEVYRRRWHLQWSDLFIFKEDIKSCFNHLRWSTRSSKLLATMVDPEVVFVMLSGGFGHTSTPMQWDVVGQAILRRSPVDMYVDDSFGAGRADHVRIARDRVVLVSEGVLAPGSAISTDKSVLAPAADILGYHVDCTTATIRPLQDIIISEPLPHPLRPLPLKCGVRRWFFSLTGRLLCWTTLLLPYSTTNAHRFQTQREYLGHLLSLLLINAHRARLSSPPLGTLSYQWVNDNTGAIAWVNTHKCSSPSSLFACMAVSQLNLVTDVWTADAIHIPGETMGEIDAMSHTFLSVQCPQLLELFIQCDPALTATAPAEHHPFHLCHRISCLLSDANVQRLAPHSNPNRFQTMRLLLNQAHQQSVANSIQVSSKRTYGTGVRRWMQFVQVFGTDPFVFMHTVPPDFSQPPPNYLYAVKHYLASHGLVMDSLVSSVILAKQRKGNRNTFLAHENNLEADKRTLPLSIDILMAERPREGSRNPLQDLAFFTALLLGFTMLTRASNYLPIASATYHLDAEHISFTVAPLPDSNALPFEVTADLLGDIPLSRITGASAFLARSKTDVTGKGKRIPFIRREYVVATCPVRGKPFFHIYELCWSLSPAHYNLRLRTVANTVSIRHVFTPILFGLGVRQFWRQPKFRTTLSWLWVEALANASFINAQSIRAVHSHVQPV